MTTTIEQDAPDQVKTFSYDLDGNVTDARNGTTDVQLTYDYRDLLQYVNQGIVPTGLLTYQRDLNGNKTQTAYLSNSIAYTYSGTNALTAVSSNFNGNTLNWTQTLDSLDRPMSQTINGKVSTALQYDSLSRVTNVQNVNGTPTLLSNFAYSYNSVGNSLTKNETIGGTRSHRLLDTYSYDANNRLLSATDPQESFSYDLAGNQLFQGAGQYNASNELQNDGKFTYTYDLNGNVTQKTDNVSGDVTTYQWSSDDQLVHVNQFSGPANLIRTVNFGYDATGNRVQKQVADLVNSANSYTRKYVYDGKSLLEEYDANNVLVAAYVPAPGLNSPIAMYRDVNHDGAITPANETFYYTKDSLGSVRDIVDNNSHLVQRSRYTSYGVTTLENDNTTNPIFIEQPFGYAGGIWDQELGTYHFGAREYDPLSGKWMSQDPIGFKGRDFNLYRYVADNPVNRIDPNGKDWLSNLITGVSSTGNNAGEVTGDVAGSAVGTAIGTSLGTVAGAAVGGACGAAVGSLGGPASAVALGVMGAQLGASIGGTAGGFIGGQVGGAVGSSVGGSIDSSGPTTTTSETPYTPIPGIPVAPGSTVPYIDPNAGQPQIGPAFPN